ncbi:hypothetical protein TrLO_g2465 [Triparma laevis f. longispina]|uniref:FH2 domain-containing protein n=1 Tax=Triparma laevis f. longispina TaxID=1714387 RepID=A0A9W7FJN2_9STRA|nr:hypothetical protein TrLO_g2465 [Triparma laevis f. longispina]
MAAAANQAANPANLANTLLASLTHHSNADSYRSKILFKAAVQTTSSSLLQHLNASSSVALLNLLAEISTVVDPGQSDRLFSEFCTTVETSYGQNSLATSDCYTTLSAYFTTRRKLRLATEYAGKALVIRIKHLGAKNSSTADSHYNLGLLYRFQGEEREALQHLSYALAIREEVDGEDAPSCGVAHMAIGKVYEDKGDATAFKHYSIAMSTFRQTDPIDEVNCQRANEAVYRVRSEGGVTLFGLDDLKSALINISSGNSGTMEHAQKMLQEVKDYGFISGEDVLDICGKDGLGKIVRAELHANAVAQAPGKASRAKMRLLQKEVEARDGPTDEYHTDGLVHTINSRMERSSTIASPTVEDEKKDSDEEEEPQDDDNDETESDLDEDHHDANWGEDAVMSAMASVLKPEAEAEEETQQEKAPPVSRRSKVPDMFSAKNPRMSMSMMSSKISDDGDEEVQGHVHRKKVKKRRSLVEWWEETPGLLTAPAKSSHMNGTARGRLMKRSSLGDSSSFSMDDDDKNNDDVFVDIVWAGSGGPPPKPEGRDDSVPAPPPPPGARATSKSYSAVDPTPQEQSQASSGLGPPSASDDPYAALAAMPDPGATYVEPGTLKPDMAAQEEFQEQQVQYYAAYYAQAAVMSARPPSNLPPQPDGTPTPAPWTAEDQQKYDQYLVYYQAQLKTQMAGVSSAVAQPTPEPVIIEKVKYEPAPPVTSTFTVGGKRVTMTQEELAAIGMKALEEKASKPKGVPPKGAPPKGAPPPSSTASKNIAPPPTTETKPKMPESPLAAMFKNEGGGGGGKLPMSPLAAMIAGRGGGRGGGRGMNPLAAMLAGRGGGGRGMGGFKKPEADTGPKMKKLHWETIGNTDGTIWGELSKEDSAASIDADASSLFPDLKDNFEISKVKPKAADPQKKRNSVVSLVDGQRSQNMNIMLAQFGRKDFADIAKAITQLDDEFVGLAGITSIIDFLPEPDEINAIKGYINSGKDPENLGKAERFILAIHNVPWLKQRLLALQAKCTFYDALDHLEEDIDIIMQASKETKNSTKFRSLLAIILKLGNELNKGTAKGAASGFKMSGLIKLTETKTNKGDTLLDYVVNSIVDPAHDMRELLHVVNDFPHVNAASRKSFGTLKAAVAKLTNMNRMVENALNKIEEEPQSGDYMGMVGLQEFFEDAKNKLATVDINYKNMTEGFKALCKYLGESDETAEPQALFGTLTQFVSSLRNAKTKIEDKMERRERAKKRENERNKRDSVDNGNKREVRVTKKASTVGADEDGGDGGGGGGPAPPSSAPPSGGKKKRGKKRTG